MFSPKKKKKKTVSRKEICEAMDVLMKQMGECFHCVYIEQTTTKYTSNHLPILYGTDTSIKCKIFRKIPRRTCEDLYRWAFPSDLLNPNSWVALRNIQSQQALRVILNSSKLWANIREIPLQNYLRQNRQFENLLSEIMPPGALFTPLTLLTLFRINGSKN